MIDIRDKYDVLLAYRRIFKLFYNLSEEENSKIEKVHSIDTDKSKDGNLNVFFTYDKDYVAYISISRAGIEIDAPKMLKNYIISTIVSKYPEYFDIIKK
jgi:hypothetical protein